MQAEGGGTQLNGAQAAGGGTQLIGAQAEGGGHAVERSAGRGGGHVVERSAGGGGQLSVVEAWGLGNKHAYAKRVGRGGQRVSYLSPPGHPVTPVGFYAYATFDIGDITTFKTATCAGILGQGLRGPPMNEVVFGRNWLSYAAGILEMQDKVRTAWGSRRGEGGGYWRCRTVLGEVGVRNPAPCPPTPTLQAHSTHCPLPPPLACR